MYILISSFSKLLELVKPHFGEHCAWLHKYNKLGIFLASGPKKSHLGGVIIVDSIDKNKLLDIISEDSYIKADVADYEIVEVEFKLTNNDLVRLLENI